jgi:hypothetical protein
MLLLLWPRYIVLLSFLTMLFAYYFLARAEEMECAEKFGQAYLDYQNRTHMFLPFKVPFADRLPSLPQNSLARAAVIVGLYGIVAIAASDLNHMYNNIPVPVY